MKVSTNQLLAIAAVLLSALIAANYFAPEAYAKVADYVALLFGIFFLNRHDDGPPNDDAGGKGLRVIAGGAAGLLLALGAVGCEAFLRNMDEVNDPTVDARLAQCRREGRMARDGGSPDVAYRAYEACKKDAGL